MAVSNGDRPLRRQPRTSGESPLRVTFDEYAAKYAEGLADRYESGK